MHDYLRAAMKRGGKGHEAQLNDYLKVGQGALHLPMSLFLESNSCVVSAAIMHRLKSALTKL
jgi:hypothetical protein